MIIKCVSFQKEAPWLGYTFFDQGLLQDNIYKWKLKCKSLNVLLTTQNFHNANDRETMSVLLRHRSGVLKNFLWQLRVMHYDKIHWFQEYITSSTGSFHIKHRNMTEILLEATLNIQAKKITGHTYKHCLFSSLI